MNTNNRMMRPRRFNKRGGNNRYTKKSNYSPINTMPMGISVPTLYNPLMWNVPSQRDFGSHNKRNYSGNSNDNNMLPVSETRVSLSKRFTSYTSNTSIEPVSYNSQSGRQFTDRINVGTSSDSVDRLNPDLREKLSVRRTDSGNNDRDTENYECPQNKEKTFSNMTDEDWLAKNLQRNPYSNIDTSSLKDFVGMEDETRVWYIVTDTSVLISNTNFLRVLLHTDKLCNMIVPQAVVEEVESISKSNINHIKAKQALCFITQNSDQIIIDEETLRNEILCVQEEILGCCSRISEQGYPLILITSNVEILHLKDTVTYKMLTMREFKLQSCHPTETMKRYLPINDIDANIKITIPNELKINEMPENRTNYTVTDTVIPQPVGYNETDVGIDDEPNDKDLPVPCQREEIDEGNSYIHEEPTFLKRLKFNSNFNFRRKSISTDTFIERNETKSIIADNSINAVNKSINANKSTGANKGTFANKSTCAYKSTFANKSINANKSTVANKSTCANKSMCANKITFANKSTNAYKSENQPSGAKNDTNIKAAEDLNTPAPDSSQDKSKTDDEVIFIKTEPGLQEPICKDDKNVMFEITSSAMEENLKVKCNEWISRFVQVMEELLTLVLLREPKYVCEAMPPPWTLYEATECTGKKFHYDSDVVDAANKLRNILFDIGGSRGKLRLDISPKQYMEMYSYGVYLTDSLQSAISDCEDLQSAAELLYKLLSDIQDTNADGRAFCDNANKKNDQGKLPEKNVKENNLKVYKIKETPNTAIAKVTQPNTTKEEQSPARSKSSIRSNESFISPSKYFLRSNRRDTPQKARRMLSPRGDFFCSLNLRRASSLDDLNIGGFDSSVDFQEPCEDNQLVNNIRSCANNQKFVDTQRPYEENQTETNINAFKNSKDSVSVSENEQNGSIRTTEDKTGEPKIVRNFIRCIDFEKRLNSDNMVSMDDVDFTCDQDFDFQSDNEFYNPYMGDNEEGYLDRPHDAEDYRDYSTFEEDKGLFAEDPVDMNHFIAEIVTETKAIFTLTKAFCEKCIELVNSSSSFDQLDTLDEAEITSSRLNEMCELLDSILKRETETSNSSIKMVSRDPELNCIEMSEDEVEKYRDVITKCLEQGGVLKETITLIIKTIKSKT